MSIVICCGFAQGGFMNAVTDQLIDLALKEDIGSGDVTSSYFVPEDQVSEAYIYAKADGVIAGVDVALEVFRRVDPAMRVELVKADGETISYGNHVIEVFGPARSILTAERTALNFLQRLSGIATQTAEYVTKVKGTKARVLDTRKTTPGWRSLEKSAVLAGGGTNHRMGLYDRAMVKDNHLVAQDKLEAIQAGILQLKSDHPGVEVELEADTLEQVAGFLTLEGVDYILLDNMSNDQMRRAVTMRNDTGKSIPLLEASGGVNLFTMEGISQTGVDFISVGALTHSAVALDLSLEFK